MDNEIKTSTELTPSQYFDEVKTRKQKVTDELLNSVYNNALDLLNKYQVTGQRKGMQRLLFHLDVVEKERELVKMGIDTFVYKDDITHYIKKVASDVVKIIELENYPREIPDDIVEVIAKVKDKFDQLYIVFTDYTGEVEKQVAKERRDKDPILFGAFKDKSNSVIIDRFYYLGDWIDEYCDLTLDKMITETQRKMSKNIAHTIKTPEDIAELKKQLNQYTNLSTTSTHFVVNESKKPSFFDKVKSIFKK